MAQDFAMAQNPEEKVALVTGAGRGIGRAIAIELARAGFALCLAARTRDQLEQTRALTGLEPQRSPIVLVDLANETAPDDLFGAVLDHFGHLDVLVNNAGWAPPRTPLVKIGAADQDRILAVNLRAPIALARMAAARMAQDARGGAIINIASAAARTTPAGETIYAASKAGLVAFTRACFAEFRGHGIRTCVIIPGLTDTALIPHNKRLDRALMLQPADVAAAAMGVVNASPGTCPLELVLEPSRDPLRAGR
jgi:NAD(P)-dependent dehydrogenase (short-subunit alcohol dehydrogenase family)